MTLFKSKYRRRIEDKILELYHERLTKVYEAAKNTHSKDTKAQVRAIIEKAEYDKQINLLKSLL